MSLSCVSASKLFAAVHELLAGSAGDFGGAAMTGNSVVGDSADLKMNAVDVADLTRSPHVAHWFQSVSRLPRAAPSVGPAHQGFGPVASPGFVRGEPWRPLRSMGFPD